MRPARSNAGRAASLCSRARLRRSLAYFHRRFFCAAGCALVTLLSAPTVAEAVQTPAAAPEPVVQSLVIGVVDALESDFYASTIEPALEAIRREFPEVDPQLKRMSSLTLTSDIGRLRPDLVIMPAGDFGQIFEEIGAHPIATRKTVWARSSAASVGAAFVVRADRAELSTIETLQGLRAAATTPRAVDGWLAARMALREAGFESLQFFSRVDFLSFGMPDVFETVLTGAADVGIVPACALEQAESIGLLAPGRLKVVAERTEGEIACRYSTPLYPDLIAGVLPWTPPEISRRLTLALLSRAAEPGRHAWMGTSDLRGIQTLFRELRLGPWAYLASWRPADIWRRFQWEILAGLGALLLLLLSEIRLSRLVDRRTAELRQAMKTQSELEARAAGMRERVAELERMGAVSQLCAMIAHELKQPIGSVRNYMTIIRLRLAASGDSDLDQDPVLAQALAGAEKESLRIAQIIDRVRGYAKKKRREAVRLDLRRSLATALENAKRSAEKHRARVEFVQTTAEVPLVIEGDPLEIELLMLNILKNAAAAAAEIAPEETPRVAVRLQPTAANDNNATIVFEVLDNGPAIDEKAFERMKHVSESVKEDGLGLGLAIVRHIVDEHGAKLEIERRSPHGLAVRVVFDALEGDEPIETAPKAGAKDH